LGEIFLEGGCMIFLIFSTFVHSVWFFLWCMVGSSASWDSCTIICYFGTSRICMPCI
jgi:hypothetical protein